MAWDTLVVGSGAGGLTAAVALARAGQKVLVLEQHYLPGGWSHSFTLGGHRFSPGIHYLGELGPGGSLRQLLEGLGVMGGLKLEPLNPDGFDHFLIGGERFDQPKGLSRWVARLSRRFPAEAGGIARYFAALQRVARDLRAWGTPSLPKLLAAPFKLPGMLRTLQSLIDGCVRDPTLKAVLAAQAGNHGLPPSRVPVAVHAAMAAHYFDGAWYPRGGAKSLPRAFIERLRAHGGSLRVRARVERLLVERGRVCGVELSGGERLAAGAVVCNADPAVVYTRLLDERFRAGLDAKVSRTEYSTPMCSGFCGVDLDLEALGYDSGNYWYYRDADLEGAFRRAAEPAATGPIDLLFLSCSSLKDPAPKGRPSRPHTLELLTPSPYPALARGAAYQAYKRQLGERLLDAAERVMPGLRAHLTFFAVGTPFTSEHFCAAWRGSAYGTAKTRWQLGPLGFSQRGPVLGLYLCGASTLSHGFAGAAYSGLIAAQNVLGLARPEAVLGRGPAALTEAHA